jgi:hypothetical protein
VTAIGDAPAPRSRDTMCNGVIVFDDTGEIFPAAG